jgi:allantoinase
MLQTHGRYGYSAIAKRPDYSFPDGRRLAIHLSLNVEHFSYGEGLGNDYGPPSAHPNTRSFAWRDYGNRVGAWRLLEFADRYDLPLGLLTNTELYDYCPEMIAAFRARGDEIVGHGRTNSERQGDMNLAEERACIVEATTLMEEYEGKKPMGWLAPYISQTNDSLDLLKEAGYRYMMDWPLDDQPVWFDTKHGPILSIPYSHDLNDSLEAVSRRTPSAGDEHRAAQFHSRPASPAASVSPCHRAYPGASRSSLADANRRPMQIHRIAAGRRRAR